jgi:hypothetical protein
VKLHRKFWFKQIKLYGFSIRADRQEAGAERLVFLCLPFRGNPGGGRRQARQALAFIIDKADREEYV